MSPLRQGLMLVSFILVCFAVAGIGSASTMPSIADWYSGLRKPGWTPPSWLFGPVWTVLYLSMAVSVWLVWKRAGFSGAVFPMTMFFIQLALNLAWSIIFFGRHEIGLALVDIVLLVISIAVTMIAFRPISAAAFWLLAPYLAWVSFATALNFSLWRLNHI